MISSQQLDDVRLDILRRRLRVLWAMLGVMVIALAVFPALVAIGVQHRSLRRPELLAGGINILMGIWLIIVPRVRKARFAAMGLRQIIRRASVIVLACVFCQTLGAQILADSLTVMFRAWGMIGVDGSIGPAFPLLAYLAVVHTAVSVIVPWNVKEAARPILIIFAAQLVLHLVLPTRDSLPMQLLGLLFGLAAGVPGVAIAALRFSKLRDWVQIKFLTTRQEEVERELSVARRIHERLFPAAGDYRGVDIAYAYEPMRQIGGDYLHCHADAEGGVMIAVIDVTGHGIGSALAVNRLHGEIKRALSLGETDPGRLLQALNDYIAATLADETVFATGLAVRVGPDRRTVWWCNAGHPPALLVRAGGSIERLETTAMMLGVDAWEGDVSGASVRMELGDVLVIYTDGAVEATDSRGRQFGIDAVEAALAGRGGGSPAAYVAALNDAARAYRAGPPQDDLLVVALGTRPPA